MSIVARAPAVSESANVSVVGYHDLDERPGFKLALQSVAHRWYLYVAHMWHPGWSVIDVTDPAQPELVKFLEGPANTWTLQVQVADGLMVASLERPEEGWGHDLSKPSSEGVLLFDVSDPVDPKQLGHFATGGRGTHRNHYSGGKYAYLAANPPGYHGNILVVLDVSDPENPVEASRWSLPEQEVSRNPEPEHVYYLHGPAYVLGDTAYLSYGAAGIVILDVSDVLQPRLLGKLAFPGLGSVLGVHSVVPVPGTSTVVVNSEALKEGEVEPFNYAFTVDVSDPSAPFVLGALPEPRPAPQTGLRSYFEKGGRFGPHNQHHPQGEHLYSSSRYVPVTYFNAGLRIYDIEDPRTPYEVGHFVPEDPEVRRGTLPKRLATQFEDVLVDARGFAYCTDKNHGLFVLESPHLRATGA